MKKLLLTFVSVAFIFESFGQWVDISPTVDQITKLCFKNSQEGFAAGRRIQYTNNSGQSWSQIAFFSDQIIDMSFINNDYYAAFVTNFYSYILHSSNNWLTYDTVFQTSTHINSFKVISANEMYLATSDGLLYTNNGFTSTVTLINDPINNILNINDSIFFAGKYRSIDYGQTWSLLPVQIGKYGVYNRTKNIISAFNFFNIFLSGDNGNTWSTFPFPYSLGFFEPGDLLFLDSLNILACGPWYHGSYTGSDPGLQYLILSTDGAQTWNPIINQITPYYTDQMNSFAFFPNDTIFVCGSNKVLRTYSPLTNDPKQYFDNSDLILFPNPVKNILHVYCKNNDHNPYEIIICDIYGKILKRISSVQPDTEVNIKDLPTGILIIKIIENNRIKCKRIVKL